MKEIKTVLVTGGAGYVGAVLVPKLLNEGYHVRVLDLYLYGADVFDGIADKTNLEEIKGDIRDQELLKKSLQGCDAVIHLACISNDPSFELNPELGKSINLDAFKPLVDISKAAGVERFIYASSSSVYGIKEDPEVSEDLPLDPLTDYSKFKADCETILLDAASDDFTVNVLRPATVCGYSPRLRLDLTVNILTNHAINKGEITVFGGEQLRPNVHIEDITTLYVQLLTLPHEKIHKKIFNAGYENHKVKDIANMVKATLTQNVEVKTIPSDDHRSYHVSSKKIKEEIGFEPTHTIEDAIADIKQAFEESKVPNPMEDSKYYNVKRMKEVDLK